MREDSSLADDGHHPSRPATEIAVNWFDRSRGLPEFWVERERFLRYHHHLISPWLYSTAERRVRNAALLRRQWAVQS